MKIRTIVIAAALGLGPAAWLAPQAMAQPQWDVVHVNLPYSIDVGKKVLPAGEYTIQQLHSDNSPILLFYNGRGVKFETSAMTIPTLNNLDTPEKTSVVLHRIGDDYYIDKIWIQGKNYGYEIPLPSAVKAREKEMSAVSVTAESSTTTTATEPTTTTTTDTTTSDTATTTSDVATNNTSDTNTAATVPVPVTDTTPVTTTTDTTQTTDTTATTDQTPVTDDSANREKKPDTDETPAMPATSAGWLAMLLSGGSLSGVGMLLRRKR